MLKILTAAAVVTALSLPATAQIVTRPDGMSCVVAAGEAWGEMPELAVLGFWMTESRTES